jgi:hypothetical protein
MVAVERIDIPDQPAPSLHPHPSEHGLLRYYEPVRQRDIATGTQCLRCPPSARSLSRSWRPTTPIAVSTLAFSRSVPEPQTRLTPPSRRAPPGQSSGRPPGSSRENSQTPRFRCHLRLCSRRLTSARPPGLPRRALLERLPGPHLTRSTAPSPDRSPRRSSANAASGGLTPSPEGRRRRANKPPSPAQHRL